MAVKGASYAGANIANSVAGGIKIPSTGTGTSGGSSSPVVPVNQPFIGDYVEAANSPDKFAADTNYIGVNGNSKYADNVLGEGNTNPFQTSAPQPDWVSPVDDNTVIGGTAQWVKAAGTIAANGTCTITAGLATAGAGTYMCVVPGGVAANEFFWAVVAAGG